MKVLAAAALVLMATNANAETPPQYPSCDLNAQHTVKGDRGGSITDPRQAHISMRANILQADLGTARKARRLTQDTTDRLYKRVEAVRTGANRYTKKQGFLSAGEVASYDRALDAVATEVCRHVAAPQGQAAIESDSDYLQQRAATLSNRIDSGVRARHLTARNAAALHLARTVCRRASSWIQERNSSSLDSFFFASGNTRQ